MNSKFNNELLKAVNSAAAALLVTDGEKSFEDSIMSGLEAICSCIDADRVHIWQNELHNGELCFVNKYEWLTGNGRKNSPPSADAIFKYSKDTPEWESKFLNNEHINSPVSQMSPNDRAFLGAYGLKSVIIIPLFLKERLWGFFSADDCHSERVLSDDEISFLKSAGLMMMNAIERNQREEKIKDAQSYISLILDATPLACRLWSKDGKILECNNKSVEMLGLNNKQEYLEHYFELSPEYQPDGEKSEKKFQRTIKKAFEKGGFTLQWMFQKLDGTPIPAEVIVERIPYRDDYLIAGFARDLREHNRMMGEIEYRDKLLKVGNDSAVALLSAVKQDRFDVSLSEGMQHLAEHMDIDRIYIWRSEMSGGEMNYKAKFSWLNTLGRENSRAFTGMSLSGFSREFNKKLFKNQCINTLAGLPPKDREMLSGLGVKSILIIPMFLQGDFWGAVTFDDCHSNRSFSNDEIDILRTMGLMMVNAILRHEMTQKIISANEAKSDFLMKMSHEMRTPLNAVLGLAELTLMEGGLNREAEKNLEQIYNAGSTLLGLVNDILDISKIEAGRLELIESVYEVPSLINDAVSQNILRIGSKPVKFILNIDKNMPAQLCGDELRVKQILNNLLSNAFKYTDKGTVELEIGCAGSGGAAWVTIRVKDTGIGISPENLTVIFSDFEQFNESNRHIEGTGLGLSITKRIVEAMGGNISIESEFGKGSVFTVRIAQKFTGSDVIGREMAESLKTFRYSDNKRNKNARLTRIKMPYARVLVVDDIIANLNITKGFLKPYEMKVDCVTNGQKAVEAIRDEKYIYNAVFMDHMMPGMDGIEATRIIREEIGTEYAKNIPIIAFTANMISGNEKMFLDKGFQAFVPKPVDIHRLDEVVRHWVRDRSKEKLAFTEKETQEGREKKVELEIEIPGINKSAVLALFGGETQLFLFALRAFAANTPRVLDKLGNITEKNLRDYVIAVHGLKGSLFNIGAVDLGGKAFDLETGADKGGVKEVSAKNCGLVKDTKLLIENINAALREYASRCGGVMLSVPDRALLERLKQCCENYDISGIDGALEELDAASYESGEDLIAWIKERVIMSEFNEAAARIAKYLGGKNENA